MEIEKKQSSRIVACFCASFAISGIASMMMGPMLPVLREIYGLNYTQMGMLLSVQPMGNMIACLLTGILPLYIGRKRTVLSLVWCNFFAFAIFTFTGSYIALLLACFLTGVARGINSSFGSTIVTPLSKGSAAPLNFVHGSFALGALISPFIIIAATTNGGNAGFKYATAFVMVLAISQFFVYRYVCSFPLPESRGGLKAVSYAFLKNREYIFALLILMMYTAAEYSITGWLVTYLKDVGLVSTRLSQILSSLLWLLMLAGRLLCAALSGKVGKAKLLLFSGAGFFVFSIVLLMLRSAAVVPYVIAAVGLCMAGIYPTALSGASKAIEGNDFAASLLIIAGSVGGMAAPEIIGVISAHAGIRGGMSVMIIMTALLVLFILLNAFFAARKNRAEAKQQA